MCRTYCDYWGFDSGVCGLHGLCAEEPAGVDFEEEELSGLGVVKGAPGNWGTGYGVGG